MSRLSSLSLPCPPPPPGDVFGPRDRGAGADGELTPSADVGSTPYSCAHCDKSFVRSDVRAKHVQTMHGIGGSGSGSGGLKRERDSSTASGSTPPM